jgi:hypothetical protein
MALKTMPVVHSASSVPTFDSYRLCLKDAAFPIRKTSYLSEIKQNNNNPTPC